MSNEEAKTILITMQGLFTIACKDSSDFFVKQTAEAVDIAITAIDMQDMQIEDEEAPNGN